MRIEIMPIEIQWMLKLPVQSFLVFFGTGTSLLLLFILTEFLWILLFGYIFVAVAVVCNLILFCIQVLNSFIFKKYQAKILLHTAVILINVPVALLYFYIVTQIIKS
jgi:hypothetical protein